MMKSDMPQPTGERGIVATGSQHAWIVSKHVSLASVVHLG